MPLISPFIRSFFLCLFASIISNVGQKLRTVTYKDGFKIPRDVARPPKKRAAMRYFRPAIGGIFPDFLDLAAECESDESFEVSCMPRTFRKLSRFDRFLLGVSFKVFCSFSLRA